MAQTFKWVAPEALATYFTTELNSLANVTTSAEGAAIDNETDLFQFINFEVNLASLTPTAGGFVSVLLLPTYDGTNYATTHVSYLDRIVATIGLKDGVGAARISKENVPIPPLEFKLALYNAAGVALAASGNTLKYRRHNGQAV